jgi:hypothetical protein
MTAWIHHLTRIELVRILNENDLSDTGTVDDLRRRLREYVQANPNIINARDIEMTRDGKNTPKAGPSIEMSTAFKNFPPLVNPLIPIASPLEPARIIDQIRKWGHHFDGKDPVQFLERITELQDAYRIAPEQTLLGLPELLRGEPLLWYRNRRHAWETWSDFCAEFRAQYFPY